jgi:AraC-like DNA-binding protein
MYETWDLEVSPLPERSRLYHLEPLGLQTPFAESLTSYIIRLAEAHRVMPKILVMREIIPLLQGHSRESALNSYGIRVAYAHTLNGTSTLAENCVHVLEKLTGCDNLRALTMLTWANVIRKRGLVRNTQAWCSLCYEEWQTNNDTIYSPLLWSLCAVKLCLHHKQALRDRCPYRDCQRTLPVFAASLRLGYCLYCKRWLGSPLSTLLNGDEELRREDFEKSYSEAIAVGELIEVAPRLTSPLRRENLASAISFYINQTPSKNVSSLARQLDISAGTVAVWQKGASSPQFETLLLISRHLGTTPRSFFLEKSTIPNFAPVRRGNNVHSIALRESRTALNSDELRLALETVLSSDEDPPPSIDEVARRLGYRGYTQFYTRFPELSRAITARHQRRNPNYRRLKRKSMSSDELRQALEAVLTGDEDPSPSVYEVARRLGYRSSSALYRRFSELCRAITVKHLDQYGREYLQRELEAALKCSDPPPSLEEVAERLGCPISMLRKKFPKLCQAIVSRHTVPIDIEGLRSALEGELLSNEEPRSMREVARSIGYPVQTFLWYLPDLCHEIAARRKAHRKRNKEVRRQMVREEVRRVVLAVHAEKKYPSQRRVRECVDRSCVSPPLFELEVLTPWREALIELGYQI